MPQRSVIGSANSSNSVPTGVSRAVTIAIGVTSRQLARGNSRIENGVLEMKSISSSVGRRMRGFVNRADEADVDQRRAEAREAAHESGQRRDGGRRNEAAVGKQRREVGHQVEHGAPGEANGHR